MKLKRQHTHHQGALTLGGAFAGLLYLILAIITATVLWITFI